MFIHSLTPIPQVIQKRVLPQGNPLFCVLQDIWIASPISPSEGSSKYLGAAEPGRQCPKY
jgi:hypothetical protein